MAGFICLEGEDGADTHAANHGMWLQRITRRITLYYENLVIADTSDVLRLIEMKEGLLDPVLYPPRKDVLAELRRNKRRVMCSLKGTLSYSDLLGSGPAVIVSNAAWSHPKPSKGADDLKDRVAFSKRHSPFEDIPF